MSERACLEKLRAVFSNKSAIFLAQNLINLYPVGIYKDSPVQIYYKGIGINLIYPAGIQKNSIKIIHTRFVASELFILQLFI